MVINIPNKEGMIKGIEEIIKSQFFTMIDKCHHYRDDWDTNDSWPGLLKCSELLHNPQM
jgi:hypothetical protein